MLIPKWDAPRKTFTCDNGKEFCGHQELSQKLGADFYFATPYHSWERGEVFYKGRSDSDAIQT